MLEASTTEPLGTSVRGRSVPEIGRRMIDVARAGLERRGEPRPAEALAPLDRRLTERRSPAEEMLRAYREGGVARVVHEAALRVKQPAGA